MDRGVWWASPWGHKRVRQLSRHAHTSIPFLWVISRVFHDWELPQACAKINVLFSLVNLFFFFFFFSFKLSGPNCWTEAGKVFFPRLLAIKMGCWDSPLSGDCCWDPRTFDHASEGKLYFTSQNPGSPPDSGQARTVRASPCLSKKDFPNFWFTEESFWLKPVLCCF